MKVLFLTGDLSGIGGIQKYGRGLISALIQNRAEVSVLELKKNNFLSKVDFVRRLFFEFLKFRPEIIISGHINFSPPVYFLKKIFNQNYLVIGYGIDVWEIKSRFKREALRKAKLVIAISDFTKEKLIRQVPEIKDKLFLLPPFVDGYEFSIKEKLPALFKKYNLSDSAKIILTISRLSADEQYKGYDKIIEALPLVIKEIPEVKYFLIGKGNDTDRIRDLIRKKDLDSFVFMTGYIGDEEIVNYYNLCDIFIMPSKGEGFGIVYLEALACGKPVIVGNQDGSRDAALNGKLGILVNPDDTKEIADAIVDILKKKAKPELVDGKYLREKVLDTYGFDKFGEKVKNLTYELSR